MGLQDNAFQRIATAKPPAEYCQGSETEAAVRADAMAMLAADAISADILVTERRLPHMLEHDPWIRVIVLTPETTLPIVGLYLRGQGKYVIRRSTILGQRQVYPEQPGPTRYEFFWRAAEALLPEHYRWRIACRASAQATGDDTLETLQTAVVHRMRQTLQARDRLLRRLAVRQDWDTAEDVVNELDQMLLWIMGALDVCARVAHVALGLQPGDIQSAGWQKTDGWMRKVKKLDGRLGELVTGNSDGKYVLEIVARLRNLIHAAPLGTDPLILVIGPHALETWVPVPATGRIEILNAMKALGGPDAWGVQYPLVRWGAQFPKKKDDPHLHPGVFAERLLPYVIKLLNDLMAAVPVHQLPGVTMSPKSLSATIPLSIIEHRTLWQLGIETKTQQEQ